MNCIICGKPTDGFTCYGKKNGMRVSICVDHVESCEHTDECVCQVETV